MPVLIDLRGKRFGRLTVCRRSFILPETRKGAYWICQCDCGRIVTVNGKNLRGGHTMSCGCLRSDMAKESIEIYRCKNPKGRKKLTDIQSNNL